ncbi:MAG TPA: hypothetical protein VFO18_16860 [Methylomirabilota bacterium]|nr:hypothetical protein [Methylomirabilota bacterium]
MVRPPRPPSSFRKPLSWLVVLAGLAAYMGLVFALTLFRVRLDLPLPWWTLQAAPPILYGLLIVLCVRRVTPGGLIGGTLTLWVAHLVLGTLTPLLAALYDPLNRGRMLTLIFPPAPLPQVVLVPLLLVPLRSLLAPASPIRRIDRAAGVEGRRAAAPGGRAAAAPSAAKPETPPPLVAEPAGWAQSRPAWPPVADAPVQPPAPEAPGTDEEAAAEQAALEWEARMSSPEPVVPAMAEDAVVRIPFARLAAQFSTDAFLLPLDRVASSLSEPDYVRVPASIVLPQLGEGLVSVPWEAVADQFPAEVLAVTSEEVRRGLRDGKLILPLDEVVGQLPHELFVAAGPGPDVGALESFPAPFQPLMAEPEAPAPAPSEPAPAAAALVPEAADTPVAEPPAPDSAEPAVAAVLEPPPPEEVVVPVTDEHAEVVRISFDRIAAQLPPDSFLLPLDRVGANLSEPGQLRIPRSVVLPQLGEGEVRVPWDAVVGQLPRHLLASSEEELIRRLPEGLLLPLDEVVRQLPPELFAAAGPGPDVSELESFPAPFQPLLPDAEAPAEALEAMVPAPAETEVTEPTILDIVEPAPLQPSEPVSDVFVAEPMPVEAEAEGEPTGAIEPVVEGEPLVEPHEEEEPTLILGAESLEPPRFDLESMPAVEQAPAGIESFEEAAAPVLEIPDIQPEPGLMESLRAELAAAAPAVESEPLRVEPPPAGEDAARVVAEPSAPRPEAYGAARRIAALMVPLTSLGVEAQSVNGVTVFTLSGPGVPDELLPTVARVMLPVLADDRAPWPLDQLTLRGPGGAVVFTPLGAPGARGPVLAAAVAQNGSLALLEILCRRAAAAFTGASEWDGPAGGAGNGEHRPELVDVEPPPRARQVAGTLGALGPVTAAALRATAGEAALYLFLPSGVDVREVGGFALDVAGAMAKAAAASAIFQVAVVRSGQRCLVIRPEASPGGPTVVAAGETAKPGLAFRQVERAVAALGSL